MNNDLEKFSEERLKDMQKHVTAGMTLGHADALLIRQAIDISISAKQAKPDFYILTDTINDTSVISTPAYRDLEDAEERNLGLPLSPVYTTPQPAHTEQDGWKLVPEEATIAMLTMLGMTGSFESMQQKYKNMLAAAPKPESE